MFLSDAELIERTGCVTIAAQCKWMTKHGIKYLTDRFGNPKVTPSNFNAPLVIKKERTKPVLHPIDRIRKKHGTVTLPRTICGIYFLIKEGEVVYVGQTINMFLRIGEHASSEKDYDEVVCVPVNEDELSFYENEYIASLKPKYNLMMPGKFRKR